MGEGRGGRPPKYEKEYCGKLDAFFDVAPCVTRFKREMFADGGIKSENPLTEGCELPTFEAFATQIGVSRGTLYAWEKKYPDFAAACERARCRQIHIIVVNALNGNYNSSFSQFLLLNRLADDFTAAKSEPQGIDVRVEYGAPEAGEASGN